jgi:hypothetical protein
MVIPNIFGNSKVFNFNKVKCFSRCCLLHDRPFEQISEAEMSKSFSSKHSTQGVTKICRLS